MRKNVAILGTIGVGKTTLIENLSELIQQNNQIPYIIREPSVSIPFVNTALAKQYKEGDRWIYPLQVGVTAAHVYQLEESKDHDYDILLADMPYSSYIYGKIHQVSKRISNEEFLQMTAAYKEFPFDHVFILKSNIEETIKRVENRNKQVEENTNSKKQNDLCITREYLEDHVFKFEMFVQPMLDKYFKNAKIHYINLPNILTTEYNETILNIYKEIVGN